jgi:hypothetical protein
MARPKEKNYDYRSGSSLLKKQQETNTKKYKAMTPAQKKPIMLNRQNLLVLLLELLLLLHLLVVVLLLLVKLLPKPLLKNMEIKSEKLLLKFILKAKMLELNKAPKSVGGAVSSPVKETKTLVQTQKRPSFTTIIF